MSWTDSSWNDLNAYVLKLEKDEDLSETWEMIHANPLTVKSIDALVLDGWKVNLVQSIKEGGYGACYLKEKKIEMIEGPTRYDRDKTLFHELVHAWYNYFGNCLYDRHHRKAAADVKQRCLKNNALVEWLSRRERATSSLLRQTIYSFDFEPEIYDCASYHAFVRDFPDRINSLQTQYENAEILMD